MILFVSAIASFLVSLAAILCCRELARRWKLYDHPSPLKPHGRPTPRIGGAGMMAGLLAGLAILLPGLPRRDWIAMGVIAFIWLVGLLDDLHGLSPWVRFVSQFVGGAILWGAGWRLHWIPMATLDLVATCLFFTFIINAMNMLDGIDGLAAGVAALGAAGVVAILPGASPGKAVAVALIAICVAMLVYNLPPASIFMGDSGSTLLGGLIGYLILERTSTQAYSLAAVPLFLFFAIPIADAACAVLRRLRGLHSPFQGDRCHFYDLLVTRGWPVGQILTISYGFTAACLVVGYLCEKGQLSLAETAGSTVLALGCAAYLLGSLSPKKRHRFVSADKTTFYSRATHTTR